MVSREGKNRAKGDRDERATEKGAQGDWSNLDMKRQNKEMIEGSFQKRQC